MYIYLTLKISSANCTCTAECTAECTQKKTLERMFHVSCFMFHVSRMSDKKERVSLI